MAALARRDGRPATGSPIPNAEELKSDGGGVSFGPSPVEGWDDGENMSSTIGVFGNTGTSRSGPVHTVGFRSRRSRPTSVLPGTSMLLLALVS